MKCPYCIKVCSKCGKILVANTMNFHKRKDSKYGLRNDCRVCRNKQSKKYDESHKKENKKRKQKNYQNNKEKILKQSKEYYLNNKVERIEKQRQYYQDNRERLLENRKQYCQDNPEIIFNANIKRRMKEESQGNGITKEQWIDMMNFFGWKCAYSGLEFSSHNKENDRTIDHIIPLDKNGEHEIWNCVPMYASYNYSKKNKDWLEWYIQQEFYSEERLNKIYEWIEYAKNKYKNN